MSIISSVKHSLDNYPKTKKVAKFVYNNAKKIRPGHIMCAVMLTTMCMSRCSSVSAPHKSQAEYMQWAYDRGAQHTSDSIKLEQAAAKHVQDSLRIVELESKLAADSMKVLHKLPK